MKNTLLAVAFASVLPLTSAEARGYLRHTRPIERNDSVPSETAASPLFRKTLVVIGDSYVANHKRPTEEAWHYRLAEKYQMEFFNYGKNGNCLAFDRKGWGVAMVNRLGELHSPADFVLVVAGHNDARYIDGNKAKNEGDDSIDVSDEGKAARLAIFREGVAKMAKALRTKYPNARIVFVSPWHVSDPQFDAVISALGEIVPSEGCLFVDATAASGIAPNDADVRRRLFQGKNDMAHLNAAGHALMLGKMEPLFETFAKQQPNKKGSAIVSQADGQSTP